MTKGGWWSASCRKGGQGRRSERGKNSGGGKEEGRQEEVEFGSNLVFSSKIFVSHRSLPKPVGHVTDEGWEEQPRCWGGKQVRKLKAHFSHELLPPPHPELFWASRRHQKVHTATNTRLNWPKAGRYLRQAGKRHCKGVGR